MNKITIKTTVNQPVDKVWNSFNNPKDIINWNFASPDWHCTSAENDLKIGGIIKSRMEAKDGSFGFDFEGIYDDVKDLEFVKYHLGDQRVVEVAFNQLDEYSTEVVETFDPETENPVEMQKAGWQAILDNFKTYTETL